jgi:enamine deaminase RidA (YjgF/YER057c/UK114 family)
MPKFSPIKLSGVLSALVIALTCGWLLGAPPGQKKKKEEATQTLQLPKELPSAVTAETRRISFYVTPLSARGLLSAQVREALKGLIHQAGGAPILRIRAFVAGSGDLRRVRDLVSEVFTLRNAPLPALSLIQSGGLPLEGAQVELEAMVAEKKDVDPHGLVFIAASVASSESPLDPVAPLATRSLDRLRESLRSAGSQPSDVLCVTCFLSSLETVGTTRALLESAYPHAALDLVQTERSPEHALAACEAVARLTREIGVRVELLPKGDGESPQSALVSAPHLILSGTQVSYGFEEENSRLAFERLQKALDSVGVSGSEVVFAHYYPLSGKLAAQAMKLRGIFFPASVTSLIEFEGLPGLDAGFAVDVIAAKD